MFVDNPHKIIAFSKLVFSLCCILVATQTNAAYTPPIGIPAPPFGIDETHYMYTGKTYTAGNFAYRDAGNGPYTHYIDNSSTICTNDDNPYGTHLKPRCSLPRNMGNRGFSVPAGSVVEIHGGTRKPYDLSGIITINAQGSAALPIFIRGHSDEKEKYPQYVNTHFHIAGSYLILENLDIYEDSSFRIKPEYDNSLNPSAKFISVRGMYIHEPLGTTGSSAGAAATGEFVVFYKNEIHDNWKSADLDAHGLYIGQGSKHVWILENNIYGNSGNGFQSCHNCSISPPEYLYLGKNNIHGDRELGIGLKFANHVIISQNKIFDYKASETAAGTAIVIGAAGPTNNVWVIFNEIYNTPYGIRIEETETDTYIIGNIFHTVGKSAINLEKKGKNVFIYNNSVSDTDQFINQTWRDNFTIIAKNNIVYNPLNQTAVEVNSSSVTDNSIFSNNLFYNKGESIEIKWGRRHGVEYSDLSTFPGGTENQIANPSFVNPTVGDYRLPPSSPAIDSGSAQSNDVYDTFQNRYNINIQVDYFGNHRPHGSGWDIGAFEAGAILRSPPAAPSNLKYRLDQ